MVCHSTIDCFDFIRTDVRYARSFRLKSQSEGPPSQTKLSQHGFLYVVFMFSVSKAPTIPKKRELGQTKGHRMFFIIDLEGIKRRMYLEYRRDLKGIGEDT